jgi:hypothetical protein
VIPSPARSEEGELTNEGNMTLNEPSMNDNGDHLGEEEGISTPLPDQDENIGDETTTDSKEDCRERTGYFQYDVILFPRLDGIITAG